MPVILVGDFNAVAKANRAYTTLTAEGAFHDSFAVAKEKVNGDWNTFNSFRNGCIFIHNNCCFSSKL